MDSGKEVSGIYPGGDEPTNDEPLALVLDPDTGFFHDPQPIGVALESAQPGDEVTVSFRGGGKSARHEQAVAEGAVDPATLEPPTLGVHTIDIQIDTEVFERSMRDLAATAEHNPSFQRYFLGQWANQTEELLAPYSSKEREMIKRYAQSVPQDLAAVVRSGTFRYVAYDVSIDRFVSLSTTRAQLSRS